MRDDLTALAELLLQALRSGEQPPGGAARALEALEQCFAHGPEDSDVSAYVFLGMLVERVMEERLLAEGGVWLPPAWLLQQGSDRGGLS